MKIPGQISNKLHLHPGTKVLFYHGFSCSNSFRGGVYVKNNEILFFQLKKQKFIVRNVVIFLYMYCLNAINVNKCIQIYNLQVKVIRFSVLEQQNFKFK